MAAATRPGRILGGNYGEDVDTSRWVVMYPPYIDSTRKISEGRKINKEHCVKEPTIGELFECTKLAGLKVEVEADKAYCRDYWIRGRIRVCLFDADGKPLEADIANRRALYAKIASMIPKYREKIRGSQGKSGGNSSNKAGKKKKKGKR